jgi:hypothetical protein
MVDRSAQASMAGRVGAVLLISPPVGGPKDGLRPVAQPRQPAWQRGAKWLKRQRSRRALRQRRSIGVDGNHLQIGACRLVGHGAPWFSIAQRAKRDVVTGSKLFLRQADGAADDFRLRHPRRRVTVQRATAGCRDRTAHWLPLPRRSSYREKAYWMLVLLFNCSISFQDT